MGTSATSLKAAANRAGEARRRWRWLKDKLARYGVAVGGIGVIAAVMLILVYLLYEVVPLFQPAGMAPIGERALPDAASPTLALSVEEQNRIAMRLSADGNLVFTRAGTGQAVQQVSLPLPQGVRITSHAKSQANDQRIALGLSNGRALVFAHSYQVSFTDDGKQISPAVEYPLGKEPVVVDPRGRAIETLAFATDEQAASLAGYTADGRLLRTLFRKQQNFLTREVSLARDQEIIATGVPEPRAMILTGDQKFLYVLGEDGALAFYDLRAGSKPGLIQRQAILTGEARVTAVHLLLGGTSLLLGDSSGGITQFFPVRDTSNRYRVARIREFPPMPAAVTHLEPEQRRRGFAAGDANGNVGLYHSTADQRVLLEQVSEAPIQALALSPRADRLLVQSANTLQLFEVDNEHPDVSWSSLWQAVWYEGYTEPRHIWQSSGGSSAFESKYSLTPLALGTLKGAFYAMLFAVPLALMGAIYTAQFMAPELRRKVKPTIEIMEALPTVILGFLAGLWLAPYVEKNLAGIFALLLLMPAGLLLFAWAWTRLPSRWRYLAPPGWRPVLLIPVVVFLGWFALMLGRPLEQALFDGNMRQWLTYDLGVTYNQRNALVVGFAMGFAVIPTIFSIAEDAVFSVPKSLSRGSLALGATPWQTLTRVVLPTASPGIFSALMIGLGRAVGETMIVLMATGNTPVTNFNIFEGMRTLSANIAVELPETAVDSSHFRILFLTALLLFLFTFVVNTAAELIRQRLRRKYGQL